MRVPIFFLPVLMLSAASVGCADKLNARIENPDWLTCKSDVQCRTTYLSCHGWVAVDRAHEIDVQRWYLQENNKALSVRDCAGAADVPQPAAICRADQCALKTATLRP